MTPAALGYRMPAEWERHDATWLAWPHARSDWPGKFEPIPWVYGDIVAKLTPGERVNILVQSEAERVRAASVITRCGVEAGRVHFHLVPTNRSWMRDTGPIFVRNRQGRLAVTDWRFNGWAKYRNWQQDDAVPDYVARKLRLRRWTPVLGERRIVLEGGSIDVNGAGCLLTTEECLLSPVQARNPGLSRTDVEAALKAYLGVRKVLWLRNGIAGDDTHGHVDDLARFVNATTIVVAREPDPTDVNYEPLRENLALLREMKDVRGRAFRVVPLPMPRPVFFHSQRLPASYANFYIANAAVLVPTFNDVADRQALSILADLFPDRPTIGVHCLDLVLGLGTLHCLTMQQPAALL